MKGLIEKVEAEEGEDGRRRLSATRTEFDSYGRQLALANLTGADVDWTSQTGKVHDQGYCGSCWSFAGNTALEATIAIRDTTNPGFTELSD